MSLEEMCSGDTVVVQTETTTTGASFGPAESYVDGASLTCNVQVGGMMGLDAGENLKYQARGMARMVEVFFSSNPGITNRHRLKWVDTHGDGLTHYLRVLGTYPEKNPLANLVLYVVKCSEETTRKEP